MKFWTVLTILVSFLEAAVGDCVFTNEPNEHPAKQRLEKIKEQVQRISIKEGQSNGYIYNIGICEPALLDRVTDVNFHTAGVTQINKTAITMTPIIIGRIDDATVIAGTDWVFLEYRGGDKYHSHCNYEERTARIMFTCSPGVLQPRSRVLEENNNKTASCYYLFEVEIDAACPVIEVSHKLSPGSVICIIFLVIVGVYLIGGAIYQRVIVGAKGMEQIPNYSFWQDFGNLQADGCNLLCRSGGKTRGSREYRGIGDDQIHSAHDEEVSHDDNLLPM